MKYPLYLIKAGTVFTDLKSEIAKAKASQATHVTQKGLINQAKQKVLAPINTRIQNAVKAAPFRKVLASPRDVSLFANLHIDQWISYVGPHAARYARAQVSPPGSIVLPAQALPQIVDNHKADIKALNRGMLGVIGEALLVASLHHLGHTRNDFIQLKIDNKKRFPDFAVVQPSSVLSQQFPSSSMPVDYLPIEVKTSGNGRKVLKNGSASTQPSVLQPLMQAAMQTLSFWETADSLAGTNRGPGPSIIFIASRDLHLQTFNLFLVTGH